MNPKLRCDFVPSIHVTDHADATVEVSGVSQTRPTDHLLFTTMKRHADQSEAPRKRRQDPVSCKLCREKKLRCDRAFPCSNCRSRGIECVSAMAAEGSTAQREASPAAFAQTKRATQQSGLLPAKDQRTYPSLTPNNTGDQTTNQGPVELSETAIWLENSAVGHDVQESPPYEFSVASLVNILFPLESSCVSNASVNASDLHRILPSRALALRLLDHFVDKVLWIDHLLHTPTLHEHLADSFKDRNYGELPNLGQLSLLCTVLGLSAYFHTSDLGMSEDEATRLSQHLLDLAQRALVAANFTRQPTLESMQSSLLILYYLLPNTRGAVDYPSLIAAMTSWARKLNMHRIDSRKEQARREREGCDHVEVELKRRMWWFLTGSDW